MGVLLIGLTILCFTGLVSAIPPCDSAQQYLDAFRDCLGLESGQFNKFYASVYYQVVKDFLNITEIPTQYAGILNDADGTIACGEGIEELRSCGQEKFSSCSPALRATVDTSVNDHRAGYCELSPTNEWQFSDLAKSYFTKIGTFVASANEFSDNGAYACLVATFITGFFDEADNASCSYEGDRYQQYINTTSFLEARVQLPNIAIDVYKCIIQHVRQQGCNTDALEGVLGYYMLFIIVPGLDATFQDLEDLINTAETPDEDIRASVVVFGDPHLILYNGNNYRFMTCSGVGNRLYLRNGYVTMYGLNTAVLGSSGSLPPTFMTEISIFFHDENGDVVAMYNSTQGSSLPTAFTSGVSSVNGGSSGSNMNGASVEALSSGIVRISYKRGGVVIAIRQISNTLTVTARMAQSLYLGATGDLVIGCPNSEISRDSAVRKRRAVSDSVCSSLGLEENFEEGCLFDEDITGDASFVTGVYTDIQSVEVAAEEVDGLYIEEVTGTASSLHQNALLLVIFSVLMRLHY